MSENEADENEGDYLYLISEVDAAGVPIRGASRLHLSAREIKDRLSDATIPRRPRIALFHKDGNYSKPVARLSDNLWWVYLAGAPQSGLDLVEIFQHKLPESVQQSPSSSLHSASSSSSSKDRASVGTAYSGIARQSSPVSGIESLVSPPVANATGQGKKRKLSGIGSGNKTAGARGASNQRSDDAKILLSLVTSAFVSPVSPQDVWCLFVRLCLFSFPNAEAVTAQRDSAKSFCLSIQGLIPEGGSLCESITLATEFGIAWFDHFKYNVLKAHIDRHILSLASQKGKHDEAKGKEKRNLRQKMDRAKARMIASVSAMIDDNDGEDFFEEMDANS